MFVSNSKYFIKSTISSTATVGGTFLLSTDTELNANLETGGLSVSMVLKNGTQIERFEITASGGTGTIVKRGLTQAATSTADISLQKQWQDGTLAYVTALAFDLLDKQGDTMTGPLKFSGTTNEGIVLSSLTTTQRLALTPDNGVIVYDSTLGENYQYIGGSWSAVTSGSTQPNASVTVAGKVQISTQAAFDAGTDTGSTGAINSVTPALAQKQISTSTAKTTMVSADSFGISDSANSGNIKRLTLAQLLATNDAQATTTTSGVSVKSTDANVVTGTDTAKYITPSQIAATIIASDNKLASSLSSVDTTTSYVKAKEIVATKGGTYRCVFDLNGQSTSSGFSLSIYGRIYKNGSPFGTEQILTTSTGNPVSQTFTEDLTFATGDLIQVYTKYANNKTSATLSNFYVKGSYFPTILLPTVNL